MPVKYKGILKICLITFNNGCKTKYKGLLKIIVGIYIRCQQIDFLQ